MPDPSAYGKYSPNSQMSFAPNMPNMSTGNPVIDMILSMLLSGSGIAPRPTQGQSVMDSYLQRQKSLDFLQVMRSSFASSLVVQKLGGMDPNSGFGSMMSMVMGQPDGLMNSSFMRALNGGNPIKAQMGLMASLPGYTTYMGTGELRDSSLFGSNRPYIRDSAAAMKGYTDTFGNKEVITHSDYDKFLKERAGQLSDYVNADEGRKDRWKPFMDDGKFNMEKFEQFSQATDGLKKNISGLSEVFKEEAQNVLSKAREISNFKGKVGTEQLTSLDLNKTRGFQSDDLMKAYVMSQDLGLFDHRTHFENEKRMAYESMGIKPEQYSSEAWQKVHGVTMDKVSAKAEAATMSSFAENSPRVLRAVADTLGTTNATQSTEALNSLFSLSGIDRNGKMFTKGSNLNMGNHEDAAYAEDLLRRMKANARVAGVSIDVITGIINEGKALASAHPELAALGGIGTIENSLKMFQKTQVISKAMGSEEIRRQGGAAHFQSEMMRVDAQDRSEPITRMLAGLVGHTSNLNLSEDKNKQILDAISEFSKNGVTQGSLGKLYKTVSSITHENGTKLWRESHDVLNQERGDQINENSGKLGTRDLSDIFSGADTKYSTVNTWLAAYWDQRNKQLAEDDARTGEHKARRGKKNRLLNGAEIVANGYLHDISHLQESGKTSDQVNGEYDLGLVLKQHIQDLTPEQEKDFAFGMTTYNNAQMHKEEIKNYRKKGNLQAIEEADMAQRRANLQNFPLDRLAQELMGSSNGDAVQAFINTFQNPTSRLRGQEILNAKNLMMTDNSAENQTAAFFQATGGARTIDAKQLRENQVGQLMSPTEIITANKERAAYTEEGRAAFLKAGAAGMTVGDIDKTARLLRDGDPAAKARVKAMGLDRADVIGASDFQYHTGLLTNENKTQFQGAIADNDSLASMLQYKDINRVKNAWNRDSQHWDERTAATHMRYILKAANENPGAYGLTPDKLKEVMGNLDSAGVLEHIDPKVSDINTNKIEGRLQVGGAQNRALTEAFKAHGSQYMNFDEGTGEFTGWKSGKDRLKFVSDTIRGDNPELMAAIKASGDVTYKTGIINYDQNKLEKAYTKTDINSDNHRFLSAYLDPEAHGRPVFDTKRLLRDRQSGKLAPSQIKYLDSLNAGIRADSSLTGNIKGANIADLGHDNLDPELRSYLLKEGLFGKNKTIDRKAFDTRFLGKNIEGDAEAAQLVTDGLATKGVDGKINNIDYEKVDKARAIEEIRDKFKIRNTRADQEIMSEAKKTYNSQKMEKGLEEEREKSLSGAFDKSLKNINDKMNSTDASLKSIADSLKTLSRVGK